MSFHSRFFSNGARILPFLLLPFGAILFFTGRHYAEVEGKWRSAARDGLRAQSGDKPGCSVPLLHLFKDANDEEKEESAPKPGKRAGSDGTRQDAAAGPETASGAGAWFRRAEILYRERLQFPVLSRQEAGKEPIGALQKLPFTFQPAAEDPGRFARRTEMWRYAPRPSLRVLPGGRKDEKIKGEEEARLRNFAVPEMMSYLISFYRGHVRRHPLVQEGKELEAAEALLSLRNLDLILFPPEARTQLRKDEPTREFLDEIAKCNRYIEGLDKASRLYVVHSFHRYVAHDLLPRPRLRDRFFGSVRGQLFSKSNVTESPDGQTEVSDTSGIGKRLGLVVGYEGREEPYGQVGAELSFQILDYSGERLADRDFQSVSLDLSDRLAISNVSWLSSVTHHLEASQYYLSTGQGRRDPGFRIIAPRMDLTGKAVKKACGLSDLYVLFYSAGFDFRDYQGDDQDYLGRDKDTSTPFLSFYILNLKKWSSHPSRTTIGMDLRKSFSSSVELDYLSGRVDLIYSAPLPRLEISPAAAWSFRNQSEYLGRIRKDNTMEFSFGLGFPLLCERGRFRLSFAHVRQYSNLADFEFDSNTVGAELSLKF